MRLTYTEVLYPTSPSSNVGRDFFAIGDCDDLSSGTSSSMTNGADESSADAGGSSSGADRSSAGADGSISETVLRDFFLTGDWDGDSSG